MKDTMMNWLIGWWQRFRHSEREHNKFCFPLAQFNYAERGLSISRREAWSHCPRHATR